MTAKEQGRLQVLNGLLAEHMTLDQAATLMGVSTRHTRRILAAYRADGAAALAHGHRGRRAPNATDDTAKARACLQTITRVAMTRFAALPDSFRPSSHTGWRFGEIASAG